MKTITTSQQKKLEKALKLVSEAQKLVESVNYESQVFANGDNTNALLNRLNSVVCTLDGNVNDKNY